MNWIYLAPLIAMLAGFIVGKMHERYEWNKLIENGTIPKPKKIEEDA